MSNLWHDQNACVKSSKDVRSEVLKGNISTFDKGQWMPPHSNLLLFVSSTFTDTYRERNILLEKILPSMRESAKQHFIDVVFFDMRWGIRDEVTLDHKTWAECQREIDRCRKESSGLCFLSLQSEKYGYTPLPRTIEKDAFESRLQDCDDATKDVALKWYREDLNSIPVNYKLSNLQTINDSDYWVKALPLLRNVFSDLSFHRSCDSLKVGRSITEWEIKYFLSTEGQKCII